MEFCVAENLHCGSRDSSLAPTAANHDRIIARLLGKLAGPGSTGCASFRGNLCFFRLVHLHFHLHLVFPSELAYSHGCSVLATIVAQTKSPLVGILILGSNRIAPDFVIHWIRSGNHDSPPNFLDAHLQRPPITSSCLPPPPSSSSQSFSTVNAATHTSPLPAQERYVGTLSVFSVESEGIRVMSPYKYIPSTMGIR
ncbi:hypothetical protein BO83DRAFT_164947 [Aspergillus eucalypticola CBS 122712]|uniref:Uncharacterized protein n=1 Tax=Aspergillus eucalypticola (strain CBS 122712 / IBT 29274) TaxID=1448314 RepID=A0A317UM84_ASPEC|nr:uncharacterized protein BO83DRAFT_164947 [Aspergillus eucalypticola CBS 122712]PWY63083.1 hypothetical protein BO83DRAFT_164947 [Aspergillus eucalypticola CBS 122712]